MLAGMLVGTVRVDARNGLAARRDGHLFMTKIYTIYKNPTDYPGLFVVREFIVSRANAKPYVMPRPLAVTKHLELARAAVPMGAVCLGRNESDEPQIVESWI